MQIRDLVLKYSVIKSYINWKPHRNVKTWAKVCLLWSYNKVYCLPERPVWPSGFNPTSGRSSNGKEAPRTQNKRHAERPQKSHTLHVLYVSGTADRRVEVTEETWLPNQPAVATTDVWENINCSHCQKISLQGNCGKLLFSTDNSHNQKHQLWFVLFTSPKTVFWTKDNMMPV